MIALITDTHFGASKDDDFYMQHQLRFIEQVFLPELEKRNIKHVIHLGDVWDKRTNLNIKTHKTFIDQFFKPLNDMGVTLYMICGNHDVYYKNTNDVNSLQHLPDIFDNIVFIDDFTTVPVDGLYIDFYPWINNGNLQQATEFAQSATHRLAIGHFEIAGIEMQKGNVAEHGLSASMFSRYEKVLSGHFHLPSVNGNIEYIGNPFFLSWVDYNTRKSFGIIDPQTLDIEYILNKDEIYQVIHYDKLTAQDLTQTEKYADKIVNLIVNDFAITDKAEARAFFEAVRQVAHSMEITVQTNAVALESITESVKFDIDGGVDTKGTIISCIDSIDVQGLDMDVLKAKLSDLITEATQGE